MNVLVTWGSTRGGTEGIAQILADALADRGVRAVARPARDVRDLGEFDAVVVGGALYANRWHRDARRFVRRFAERLAARPVWFFSSGPLDDSAERGPLAPAPQVQALMDRVGARGHVTFGGRLARDARGFPAAAMAKTSAGDWRNPARIRAWADDLANELPYATPGTVVAQPAAAWSRLVGHGVAIGALGAAGLLAVRWVLGDGVATTILHAVLVTAITMSLARHYFAARGARDPLPAAATITALFAAIEAIALGIARDAAGAAFTALAGYWLPIALVLATAWLTGVVVTMLPFPRPPARHAPPPAGHAAGSGVR
ncbi:MAG: hypothetical protein H6709_20170 [Kofleriaceae bacterium]|nr:hypothetical protein [Kofleriaceae bacterium]MCB9574404.1 hypothetical protein [Kofleriaceae bacterium]